MDGMTSPAAVTDDAALFDLLHQEQEARQAMIAADDALMQGKRSSGVFDPALAAAFEAAERRRDELEKLIAATPARTVAGAVSKLLLDADRSGAFDPPEDAADPHESQAALLCSAIADLVRIARAEGGTIVCCDPAETAGRNRERVLRFYNGD